MYVLICLSGVMRDLVYCDVVMCVGSEWVLCIGIML